MSDKLIIKENKISVELPPCGDNVRNSEGDFIRLKDGRIMFAYSFYNGDTFEDHGKCDICAIYSQDDGDSFNIPLPGVKPKTLISAQNFNEKNVMSVTLMHMDNGDLGIFYLLKHIADSSCEIMFSRSDNEGESFYETVHVLPSSVRGYFVVNNSRVIKLSNGTIIIPAAKHEFEMNDQVKIDGRGTVYFYESHDDARSWSCMPARLELGPVTYSKCGLQEPGVIELQNGVLYAYFRTDLGRQYEALSCDNGLHWFGPQASRFSSPDSPMKLVQNPYTGKFYAIWNPIPKYNGRNASRASMGRTQLAISQSDDGFNYGPRDYTHREDIMDIIEDDPDRGYCYPAAFFTDSDTMLLAYCSGGVQDGICLSKLTIRKIKFN